MKKKFVTFLSIFGILLSLVSCSNPDTLQPLTPNDALRLLKSEGLSYTITKLDLETNELVGYLNHQKNDVLKIKIYSNKKTRLKENEQFRDKTKHYILDINLQETYEVNNIKLVYSSKEIEKNKKGSFSNQLKDIYQKIKKAE